VTRKNIPDDTKQGMYEMIKAGASVSEISDRYQVPREVVYKARYNVKNFGQNGNDRVAASSNAKVVADNAGNQKYLNTSPESKENAKSLSPRKNGVGKFDSDPRKTPNDELRELRSKVYRLIEMKRTDMQIATELGLSAAELGAIKADYLTISERYALAKLYESDDVDIHSLYAIDQKLKEAKMIPSLAAKTIANVKLVDYTDQKLEEKTKQDEALDREIAFKASKVEQYERREKELEFDVGALENKADRIKHEVVDLKEQENIARQGLANVQEQIAVERKVEAELRQSNKANMQVIMARFEDQINEPEVLRLVITELKSFIQDPETKEIMENSRLDKDIKEIPEDEKIAVTNERLELAYLLGRFVATLFDRAFTPTRSIAATGAIIANN
jgi:hypothetical protein